MKNHLTTTAGPCQQSLLHTLTRTTLTALLIAPALAAAGTGTGGSTEIFETTCGFFSNIKNLLNAISIIVVTIAIIFAGYQIAFAHKRISDVAPIMIGAILIGAATQIAQMFLSSSVGNDACDNTTTTGIIPEGLTQVAAAAQWLLAHA
jgi:type IV secretion system protein VirB2